jgi:drug/metabolite transporter (DMT)-like permease
MGRAAAPADYGLRSQVCEMSHESCGCCHTDSDISTMGDGTHTARTRGVLTAALVFAARAGHTASHTKRTQGSSPKGARCCVYLAFLASLAAFFAAFSSLLSLTFSSPSPFSSLSFFFFFFGSSACQEER